MTRGAPARHAGTTPFTSTQGRDMPANALRQSELPFPLFKRGKVRDVYDLDDELLLVATDRISAFDVVLEPPIPGKGAVLTQLSAWWFEQTRDVVPNHMISADPDEIARRHPELAPHRAQWAGRAMLVRKTTPFPVECVVRGYLSGSAWKEYRAQGTLAGEPLPAGLRESDRLEPPIFSPATKAEVGHDENITFARMCEIVGRDVAETLRTLSLELYARGRDVALERGIIIADTKFEFGRAPDGTILLIDEVLTPDSSRFWPAEEYTPGRAQRSFDKQPVRDYLDRLAERGDWDKRPPAPPLPPDVVEATSRRYREAYERLTGRPLPAFDAR